MGDRAAKAALYREFAVVGKALGNPGRLELLDLLAQGPRSVEELADAAGLAMSTCSAHLQTLREAGLVETRRDGKRIYYSLSDDDVAGLWHDLTGRAARAYLGPEDTDAVDTAELLRRVRAGDTLVLDVRPDSEYAAGHLPGAVHIPLEELAGRLAELPADREIVAYCRGQYCVLAHDAVRVLASHGLRARRAVDGMLEWRLAGHPVVPGVA
jgi:rhodanese-related sulfurtransferase/biotin operon repressor